MEALASVTRAVPGVVGIYCGNAGATHDPAYFVEAVDSGDSMPLMTVCNGVSRAVEGDRLSLLSLGMKQFSLPDLILTTPRAEASDAIRFFFDLLTYVAERGGTIPEGETIGRDEHERLRVSYQPSPIDNDRTVWRVDLP